MKIQEAVISFLYKYRRREVAFNAAIAGARCADYTQCEWVAVCRSSIGQF